MYYTPEQIILQIVCQNCQIPPWLYSCVKSASSATGGEVDNPAFRVACEPGHQFEP
jgi:hypothetical protein